MNDKFQEPERGRIPVFAGTIFSKANPLISSFIIINYTN